MKSALYSFRLVSALRRINELILANTPERVAIITAIYELAPDKFSAVPLMDNIKADKVLDCVLKDLANTSQKHYTDIDDLIGICRKLGIISDDIVVEQPKADIDLLTQRCHYISDSGFLLGKITRNITKEAIDGELDPVYGRQDIIDAIVQTLMRRNKANPVLVGPAGVGKTAIIEGLAQRMVDGTIRGPLSQSVILELSPSQIMARSDHSSQVAAVLQQIIMECASLPWVILFADEIHSLFATKSMQTSDAANILKPALARRDIRLIGSTTPQEFAGSIEPDRALERRVQRINVGELPFDEVIKLVTKVAPVYEGYHQVGIPMDNVSDLVTYSTFYSPNHSQPDAALSFIDSLMARARLKNTAQVNDGIVADVLSRNENPFLAAMVTKDTSKLLTSLSYLTTLLPNCSKTTESIVAQGLAKSYRKPLASALISTPNKGLLSVYAEELSFALYGRNAVIYYDLQEFIDSSTVNRWLGAPAGYILSDKGGSLITQLNTFNNPILVLDNLDAAHSTVADIVRNMLTNGFVTDTLGRTAYLSSAIVLASIAAGSKSKGIGFGNKTTDEKPKHQFVGFGFEDQWPQDTTDSVNTFLKEKFGIDFDKASAIAQQCSNNISTARAKAKGS